MKFLLFNFCTLVALNLISFSAMSGQVSIETQKGSNGLQLHLKADGKTYLSAPEEGLWSIAHSVDDTKPIVWQSAAPSKVEKHGPWTLYLGELPMGDGKWELRDACRSEDERIRCIRRFEWHGKEILRDVVLSVRWLSTTEKTKVFQPGLHFYGNLAGKKNSLVRSAHMEGKPGEFTIFEEHRFPMPFTSLEWKKGRNYYGAALHSIPSPAAFGNLPDQWWSMGAEYYKDHTELKLLSGPVGYNEQRAVIKFMQQRSAPYAGATLDVKPKAVIEKTYFLQAYPVVREGDGFRKPIHTSIDIFKPYFVEEFPSFEEIIEAKSRFAINRFFEGTAPNGKQWAGFFMDDPGYTRRRIVMGWAGQSDAPGYGLQFVAQKYNRPELYSRIQKSMDFLASTPFTPEGFKLRFDTKKGEWTHYDHVSQGQALFIFAKAIARAKKIKELDTSKWEVFFKKAASFHAERILKKNWRPVSTNEGFHVAPLTLGYQLYGDKKYRKAALKAADHYGKRHLSMRESYWGGTLDARGEDKEGAWAAFQAFMAAYDLSGDKKYLDWAAHAGDAMLSYTMVWDIPMPAGRLADHAFKTRGWTFVSPQNQHLDVYGVLTTPWLYRLGELTNNERIKQMAILMYVACGQMIDPFGSQGEQMQETNFVQSFSNIDKAGKDAKVWDFRGGYDEDWRVLWITAHFLTAAAIFEEMGVEL